MSNDSNAYLRSSLPPNTVVPENHDLFIPYFNRLYEDIAYTVNDKDYNFFPIPVTDTATNIPNLPNFGAFFICVSGEESGLPTLTATLCKADATAGGVVTPLCNQNGTIGVWAAATLTISSTADNFQINHSVAGEIGNFNIRILGTQ